MSCICCRAPAQADPLSFQPGPPVRQSITTDGARLPAIPYSGYGLAAAIPTISSAPSGIMLPRPQATEMSAVPVTLGAPPQLTIHDAHEDDLVFPGVASVTASSNKIIQLEKNNPGEFARLQKLVGVSRLSIAIDVSGSMGWKDIKIGKAQPKERFKAVSEFMGVVASSAFKHREPGYNQLGYTLIKFGNTVEMTLESDAKTVRELCNGSVPNPKTGTNLIAMFQQYRVRLFREWDAELAAGKSLSPEILVVATDGEPSARQGDPKSPREMVMDEIYLIARGAYERGGTGETVGIAFIQVGALLDEDPALIDELRKDPHYAKEIANMRKADAFLNHLNNALGRQIATRLRRDQVLNRAKQLFDKDEFDIVGHYHLLKLQGMKALHVQVGALGG